MSKDSATHNGRQIFPSLKAFDHQISIIDCFHPSRRSTADAQHLLHQAWQQLVPDCLPIFSDDGLNQYFYAITAHFGTWHKPLALASIIG